MWKGRFSQPTAELLQSYSESISFDWRLWRQDIAGSIAHSAALLKAGLLTEAERDAIVQGLQAIGAEIEAGTFQFKLELEDIHMNIESELTRRIGDAGAKLHTARSRNDQIALDLRLYLREECDALNAVVRDLQRALVELGARNAEVVIPGYTHLQRAQPVFFAHHLLAYVEMLDRDAGRITDARRRLNVLPLGSGAIAGSTIVLDRELVARELGFPAVTQNSMDAVSDRDFAVELLAALALLAVHLSRLSEDVILWASSEFGFVTLSDAFTTGSSLMPQKKNPDVAELTRGKTGRVIGNLLALLTTLKGLPMTYNRDMQEDKEPVFDSVDTVKAALAIFAAMLSEARVNAQACAAAVADPLLLATDLADYLVNRGVPFRQAHEVIGRAVALAAERSCPLPQLTLADFQTLSPAFADDLYECFDLRTAMAARRAIGAPSPENVAAQLARWQSALKQNV
ncbi:MAG TPA: argininosuccinate lyase [Chthoniobacteraceae bacterium]|jgi:argininosuccinate lyase|nr:argininosuccinate lyase [Chthoniobacteraceae bacterium]